jgi:transposase
LFSKKYEPGNPSDLDVPIMGNYKNFLISPEERLICESLRSCQQTSNSIKNRIHIILLKSEGKTVYEIARNCRTSRTNVYKWLSRYRPGNREWFLNQPRRPKHSPTKIPDEVERIIVNLHFTLKESGYQSGARSIQFEMENLCITHIPSISTINRILKKHGLKNKRVDSDKSEIKQNGVQTPKNRSHRLIPANKRKNQKILTLSNEERKTLESWKRSTMTKAGISKRSEIIFLLAEGNTPIKVARIMRVSRQMVYKWAKRFLDHGLDGLMRRKPNKIKKYEDERIKAAVFAMLHAPPSDYGINRTSWKLDDLKLCLLKKGIAISKGYIRKIIKGAGYSWRKAKVVLTSNDPEYRKKLDEIQSILSNLKSDGRFFSIDEFGPFAIKMHGGRKLVAPDKNHSIPQYQKSKGFLIVTGALELATNQVTHFYSQRKNTAEMIKLLEILLAKYKTCKNIYLSWDAARWHASKALYERVDKINNKSNYPDSLIPKVTLAPLPKSAQFLNIIESVFSGMATAIIHNSNYESKKAAKVAIDRYFKERNENFKKNPKKAGKKIWRNELVIPVFNESNICKDKRWL